MLRSTRSQEGASHDCERIGYGRRAKRRIDEARSDHKPSRDAVTGFLEGLKDGCCSLLRDESLNYSGASITRTGSEKQGAAKV